MALASGVLPDILFSCALASGPFNYLELDCCTRGTTPNGWEHDEQPLLADRGTDGTAPAVFSKCRRKPRVDDTRVLNGVIAINRNGLRWRYGSAEYGPPKTLYNCWKPPPLRHELHAFPVNGSDMGVFARIMTGLAASAPDNETISIDATYPLPGSGLLANYEGVKAHRTASSLG
jgi:transposase